MGGNRSFFKIMMPGFHQQLNLPPAFCNKLEQEKSDKAVIRSPIGEWEIQVCRNQDGGQISLTKGWPDFVHCHGLRYGDSLVFEHTGNLHFNVVYAFDMSACEKEFSMESKEAPQNTEKQQAETESRATYQTKHPSFTLRMQPSHGSKSCSVGIPANFWRSNNMKGKRSAVLRDPRGREWAVKLKLVRGGSDRLRMEIGWDKFYEGNELKVGDVCDFYLLSSKSLQSTHVVMAVQIRRLKAS